MFQELETHSLGTGPDKGQKNYGVEKEKKKEELWHGWILQLRCGHHYQGLAHTHKHHLHTHSLSVRDGVLEPLLLLKKYKTM